MTRRIYHADISLLTPRNNLLVNGSMMVAQRLGAAGASATSVDWTYQSADRWKTVHSGGTGWQIYTSVNRPVGGSSRSLLFNSLINSTQGGVIQIIENVLAFPAIGKSVSLQLQLYATADITDVRAAVLAWTGATNIVTDPVMSWGLSGINPTWAANWSPLNTPVNLGPTTTWQLIRIENLLVPTNTNNLAVMIWCEDETQASSAHSWAIADVQLEIGSKCSQFERMSLEETIQRCERYYQKSYPFATAPGTAGHGRWFQPAATAADTGVRIRWSELFGTPMRGAPTVRLWDNAGNLGKISTASGDTVTDNVVPLVTPVISPSDRMFTMLLVQGPAVLAYDLDAEL